MRQLLIFLLPSFLIILISSCQKTSVTPTKTHPILINDSRFLTITLSQDEFDALVGPDNTYYLEIYQRIKDDFDFILEIYNNDLLPSRFTKSAFHGMVSSSTSGIGFNPLSTSSLYGSAGRLKAFVTVPTNNALNVVYWNQLERELLHTWANYGIKTETFDGYGNPTSDDLNWGYSGAGTMLHGFDQSTLRTKVDGDSLRYSFTPVKSYFTMKYSDFELYLMGLIPSKDVKPFDVFTNLLTKVNDTTFRAKTRTTYTPTVIESRLGIRQPSSTTSQKAFRMLIVVFTVNDLNPTQISNLNFIAEQFSRQAADDYAGYVNFFEATGGRATLSMDPVSSSAK